jgi:hypothetical protein
MLSKGLLSTNGLLPGGTIHKFGHSSYNQLTTGTNAYVSLQWSDEAHTSANDYDLFILNAAGTSVVRASTDTQDGTGAPFEIVDDVNPGERIVVWKANAAEPRYLRVACVDFTTAL